MNVIIFKKSVSNTVDAQSKQKRLLIHYQKLADGIYYFSGK